MKYLKTFEKLSTDSKLYELKGREYMNMDDDDDFDPSSIKHPRDMHDYFENSNKRRLKKMINTWDDDFISELILKRCGVFRYCKDNQIELSEIIDFLNENFEKIKTFINKGIGNGEFTNENGNKDNVLLRTINYIEYPTMKEIAIMLIDAGVNLETSSINGETAIIKAAEKGEYDIVKKLINKGININKTTNVDNKNILQIIADSSYLLSASKHIYGASDEENSKKLNNFKKIIDIILNTNVDIEHKTKYNSTPLMYTLGIILRDFSESEDQSDEENFKDNESRIYLACQLINKGANLKYETPSQFSTNMHSIKNQLIELNHTVIDYLLVNCKNSDLEVFLSSHKYNL